MGKDKEIKHPGVVTNVSSSVIKVNITTLSACASCSIKGVCSISDIKDKVIEVPNPGGFSIGQKVLVILCQKKGFKALFLGYVLPFLLILFTLIVSSTFIKNELFTGLISLSILVPYYLVLFYSKEMLKNEFSFTVKTLTR